MNTRPRDIATTLLALTRLLALSIHSGIRSSHLPHLLLAAASAAGHP